MNITKAISFNVKEQKINAKNVLQNLHVIPIVVNRYFTDVDGVIIAKAAAPAAMKTRYPVFMFGDFDRQGGYAVGRKAVAPSPGTYFLMAFVNGSGNTSYNITGQNGLNNIQAQIQIGDIVLVYTDSLTVPTTYVWFVLSSEPVSLASILANSGTTQNDKRLGKLCVYAINMNPSDRSQFSEDLNFSRTDNIGNYGNNTVQPLGMYRSIMDKQRDFITLKVSFDITQFLGINYYHLFAVDSVRFEFKTVKY